MNSFFEHGVSLPNTTVSRRIYIPGLVIIGALIIGTSIGLWPMGFWTLFVIVASLILLLAFPSLPLLFIPFAAIFYKPLFTSTGEIAGNVTALDLMTHIAILSLLINLLVGRIEEPWKKKTLVVVVVLIVINIAIQFIIRQVFLHDRGVLIDLALQWKLYLQFVMLGVATLLLVDGKSAKFIKILWGISIAITSFSVLFQVSGIWTAINGSSYPSFGTRGVGLLQNPNIASMFFVVSFGLIIDQLWSSDKSTGTWTAFLWYSLALLQVLAMLATGARAAVLVFFLMILLFSALRTKTRVSVLLQSAVVLSFATAMLFLSSPGAILLERFNRSSGESILLDNNVSVRLEMGKTALKATLSADSTRQLSGWGRRNFLLALRSTNSNLGHQLQTTDNTIIDWLIDVGVIGTLINMMLVVFLLWHIPRRLRGKKASGNEWVVVSTIMLSFTYSTLSSPPISATILGLGCILAASSFLNAENHSIDSNLT